MTGRGSPLVHADGTAGEALWMQTIGACQVGTSSAASGLSTVVHVSGCAPLLLYVLLYGLDTYASRQLGQTPVSRAVRPPEN